MEPNLIHSDEGLALKTSAIVSFTVSISLINTQLKHQFALGKLATLLDEFSIKLSCANLLRWYAECLGSHVHPGPLIQERDDKYDS